MNYGGTSPRLVGALLTVTAAALLSACGSTAAQPPAAATTAPQIDAATLEALGACVVDRMQGGTGIDRVQVFRAGHDTALNLFLSDGRVTAAAPGPPSYVLWVTGAEPPQDVVAITSGAPGQPTGATLGVWMIEPVDPSPAAIGQPACQDDADWGTVQESQGLPALDKLGGSVDLPKSVYNVPGPPTSSP